MRSISEIIYDMEDVRHGLLQKQELYGIRFRPMLKNRNLIPRIFEVFKKSARGYMDDEEFVFIVLLLYSPTRLFGNNMPSGMRVVLSRVLGKNGAYVSRLSKNLLFYFKNYKAFREDVAELYNIIFEWIKK